MSRILIVDDEPAICWAFDQALSDQGHEVQIASTGAAAVAAAQQFHPDAVVLDYRLPGDDGLTALRALRDQQADMPVILMTAFGSLDLAVQALAAGAFDYLPKPFHLDEAVRLIEQALARTVAAPTPEAPASPSAILGVSRAMQDVFRDIALAAPLDVPVLITGESGVGKEMVARALHHYSRRPRDRFIPVCVPALSESLLESELFGHVKGAFTGAERDHSGLLAQADGGTAFFDEIGDIPLQQQVKLLRVLEDRRLTPVGGAPRQSNFRLIAATHRDLPVRVREGAFREDLYFRLSVFQIRIPPLRDRPEDIPELAARFLEEGPRSLTLTAETLEELQRRHWPGNVRELRSALHHASIVCRGEAITPDCLPPATFVSAAETFGLAEEVRKWGRRQVASVRAREQGDLYERFLEEVEPALFEVVLAAVQGQRKAAAEMLGVHRETLRKRLRRHDLRDAGTGEAASD